MEETELSAIEAKGSASLIALPRSERRRLGIFYTPEWLARILVDWALDSNAGPILDPSFGGCAFLEAARLALIDQGVPQAARLVYGFDIDRRTIRHVRGLVAEGVPRENLVFSDFLSERSLKRFNSFSAVVGNPPYIRHHAMDDDAISRAQALLREANLALPLMAGAWAYFALLAAVYVKPGGRLALILPGALLQADYGEVVIAQLEQQFGSLRLIHVHERLFNGTTEESIILLGRGRGGVCRRTYRRVTDVANLIAAFNDTGGDVELSPDVNYKLSLLPRDVITAWETIRANEQVRTLGSIADVRIGIVTGANSFFIRPTNDPLLDSRFIEALPVVTAKRWLVGPTFGSADLWTLDMAGERTRLMFIKRAGRRGSRLRGEIDAAARLGVSERIHCAKRKPWYQLADYAIPDIFFPYMSSGDHHMVRNDAKASCTNAIHRVYVHSGADASSVVASSFTSLFAFECELFGRHYGGGVLKLEPTASKNLSVISAGCARSVDRLAKVASSSGYAGRREIADEQVLIRHLKFPLSTLTALRRGISILAKERRRRQCS